MAELRYAASAVAFACAAFLAYKKHDGWGWFVFAGIIVGIN